MRYNSKLLIATKDFSGKYIFGNDAFLQETGLFHNKRLIGRHEYDVCTEVSSDSIGGAQSLIEQHLKEDAMACRGQEIDILYAFKWCGVLKFFVANKSPYRDEKQKIIGSIASHYEISNPSLKLLETYLAAESGNIIVSEQSKEHIQWYKDDFLKNIPLNSRELQCVNLLAKGNTAKKIAGYLGLSYRTVESYLESARNKLNCVNSHELIAKCFAKGLIDISEGFPAF